MLDLQELYSLGLQVLGLDVQELYSLELSLLGQDVRVVFTNMPATPLRPVFVDHTTANMSLGTLPATLSTKSSYSASSIRTGSVMSELKTAPSSSAVSIAHSFRVFVLASWQGGRGLQVCHNFLHINIMIEGGEVCDFWRGGSFVKVGGGRSGEGVWERSVLIFDFVPAFWTNLGVFGVWVFAVVYWVAA